MFGCPESLIEIDKVILIDLINFFSFFVIFLIFKIDNFILIDTWMLMWHFKYYFNGYLNIYSVNNAHVCQNGMHFSI